MVTAKRRGAKAVKPDSGYIASHHSLLLHDAPVPLTLSSTLRPENTYSLTSYAGDVWLLTGFAATVALESNGEKQKRRGQRNQKEP